MTINHFPGQEHLPHPTAGQPGIPQITAKPAPQMQPAPHPVARRATALKAAIDGGWDSTIEETLLAAAKFDEFLRGGLPPATDERVVNVYSGSTDVRKTGNLISKRVVRP